MMWQSPIQTKTQSSFTPIQTGILKRKCASELPILTIEELDTKIASYPPKPKKDRSQNKTLDQVMTELDNEFEVETSDRH